MRFENKLGRRTWTPGRRKLEGLVFSRGLARSGWEKGRGSSPDTSTNNFTPAASALSVTYAAAARDSGKTRIRADGWHGSASEVCSFFCDYQPPTGAPGL